MKTVPMEEVTLDRCVAEAQQETVILTRQGHPIALVTSVAGMDEEQIRLSSDPEFWKPKADTSATKQPAKQSADAAGKTASATPKPASR